MKNILDYRLVILDKDANIIYYPVVGSGMHQDCLDDFAKKLGYSYSSEEYLVKEGNVIFKNAGGCILLVYLPFQLSDEQLYQMDYIHNWLDQVEMMEAVKYGGSEKEWYQFCDDVSFHFSHDIIQSYYPVKKR